MEILIWKPRDLFREYLGEDTWKFEYRAMPGVRSPKLNS